MRTRRRMRRRRRRRRRGRRNCKAAAGRPNTKCQQPGILNGMPCWEMRRIAGEVYSSVTLNLIFAMPGRISFQQPLAPERDDVTHAREYFETNPLFGSQISDQDMLHETEEEEADAEAPLKKPSGTGARQKLGHFHLNHMTHVASTYFAICRKCITRLVVSVECVVLVSHANVHQCAHYAICQCAPYVICPYACLPSVFICALYQGAQTKKPAAAEPPCAVSSKPAAASGGFIRKRPAAALDDEIGAGCNSSAAH